MRNLAEQRAFVPASLPYPRGSQEWRSESGDEAPPVTSLPSHRTPAPRLTRQQLITTVTEISVFTAALALSLLILPVSIQAGGLTLLASGAFLVWACYFGVFERALLDRCHWYAWRQAVLGAAGVVTVAAVLLRASEQTLGSTLTLTGVSLFLGRAARDVVSRSRWLHPGEPVNAVVVRLGETSGDVDRWADGDLSRLKVVASLSLGPLAQSSLVDSDVAWTQLGEVESVLNRMSPDVLLAIPAPDADPGMRQSLDWLAAAHHVPLYVWLDLPPVARTRLRVESAVGETLVAVRPPACGRRFALLGKSVVERVVAGGILAALAAPMLVISLLVRLTSDGPALFVQRRVGLGGTEFRMYKFRTMCATAEQQLAALQLRNVHLDGPLFKIRDDPRVTPLGRWLRRTSLDELPQLLNVVRGEMALVGPRPPLAAEVAAYDAAARRRLLVKPGLTGLWQVSGRSDLSWSQSRQLDLYYVDNWSPMLDLEILWRTTGAVFSRRGAY